MATSIRLQKYLSECGVASRRKAAVLIEEGRVKVNGEVVSKPAHRVTPGVDKIYVGKKPVLPPQRGVLYLNKPSSVVTTLDDPAGRKTVAHFLTKKYRNYFPVGRLDYESTGLVIMTNDGELANRLAHPRYEMERVYRVRVLGHPGEQKLQRLARGIKLKDGVVFAEAEFVSKDEKSTWLKVSIAEGRNRIVRRMMEHIRHPVIKLHRIEHGPCRLGKLKSGQIRVLTEEQYRQLKKKVCAPK